MKIAVCSKEETSNAVLANRFARAEYFAIFDSESKKIMFLENKAKMAAGGASGVAVKILGDQDVEVVLCPEVGPKALDALTAFEIKAYNFKGASTVTEAIDMYITNQLSPITSSHNKKYK